MCQFTSFLTEHFDYLLNQPNEGKWKEKYIITSL